MTNPRASDRVRQARQEFAEAWERGDRHRAILQTAMDGFWLVDACGYLLDVNDSYCRMSGYSRDELLAMHISDLEGEESPDETRAHVQQIMTEGQDRFETTHRRRDGSVLHVEVSAQYRDDLLVAFIHDVTEQHEAAHALRESEERYRTILQTALDGFWRVDVAGRLLEVNDAYCRMSGYCRDEIVGRRMAELKAPGTEQEAANNLRKTLEVGAQRFESVHRAKDGGLFILDVQTACQPDGTVVAFMRDITEKKRAEEALRESRERYRNILETAMDGFRVADTEGRILEVNDTYCRMTGYGRDELLAMHTRDVDMDSDRQTPGGMPAQLADVMAFGEGRFEGEHRRKDGAVFPTEVSIQYRRGVFLAFIRDITARKEVERSLQESMLKAEAASIAKSRFLANMSHEIRTPMNGVIGMARQLLGTDLSAEQRGYVSALKASSKALLHVISDILDFSKIEAGRMEVEAIDFDLGAVFEDTAALLAIPAGEKGLALQIVVGANVPTMLRGDHMRLRQVLLNLGLNAVKFTERGQVVLRARPESESGAEVTLRFEVEDTGMGIPDDKMGLLFGEFQQGDSSITRKYGGSGLGLAISRGLVALMRGEIGLERQKAGTMFWFTAVFARSVDVAREAPRSRVTPLASGLPAGLRVLLAEDDRTNQLVAKAMLSRLGCAVDVVANGVDAVAAAVATAYDVVFMDMQMPGLDGLEATRELRRLGVRVPVVALTAHASQEARDECLAVGMDDYVSKPIDPAALSRVLVALGKRQRRDCADTTET